MTLKDKLKRGEKVEVAPFVSRFEPAAMETSRTHHPTMYILV